MNRQLLFFEFRNLLREFRLRLRLRLRLRFGNTT